MPHYAPVNFRHQRHRQRLRRPLGEIAVIRDLPSGVTVGCFTSALYGFPKVDTGFAGGWRLQDGSMAV